MTSGVTKSPLQSVWVAGRVPAVAGTGVTLFLRDLAARGDVEAFSLPVARTFPFRAEPGGRAVGRVRVLPVPVVGGGGSGTGTGSGVATAGGPVAWVGELQGISFPGHADSPIGHGALGV